MASRDSFLAYQVRWISLPGQGYNYCRDRDNTIKLWAGQGRRSYYNPGTAQFVHLGRKMSWAWAWAGVLNSLSQRELGQVSQQLLGQF